ncbi:MAG: hypothetical protein ACOCNX_00825 [Prevotella sp.]
MSNYVNIYRYMSSVEKNLLAAGKTIVNHTDHGECRGDDASTSQGFCFAVGDKQEAVLASRFLKGIVTMQWLMVATIDAKDTNFHVGTGRYVGQFDNEGYPLHYNHYKELYTEEMNIADFRDVHFYPVRGLSIKKSKVSGFLTAIVPPAMANNREQRAIRLCNQYAHENENKYTHYKEGEDFIQSTGDFTRVPWNQKGDSLNDEDADNVSSDD